MVADTLAKAGEWEHAVELLDSMSDDGPEPDVGTFNAVLQSLAVKQKWQQAKALAAEAKSRGLADTQTYNIVLTSFPETEFQEAEGYLVSMENPNTISYNIFLSMCQKYEPLRGAKIFQHMRQQGVTPDI